MADLSVGEMLRQLGETVEHHRGKLAWHREQERDHRERALAHEEALRLAVERLEAFQAAAAAAGEVIRDLAPAPPPAPAKLDDINPNERQALSRMMWQLVEEKAPDEIFGATKLTQEIRARWGAKLRRRIDPRSVATTLRRWGAAGRLDQVRDGRSYSESLYRRTGPLDEEGPTPAQPS